jgi:hypothetical protein
VQAAYQAELARERQAEADRQEQLKALRAAAKELRK